MLKLWQNGLFSAVATHCLSVEPIFWVTIRGSPLVSSISRKLTMEQEKPETARVLPPKLERIVKNLSLAISKMKRKVIRWMLLPSQQTDEGLSLAQRSAFLFFSTWDRRHGSTKIQCAQVLCFSVFTRRADWNYGNVERCDCKHGSTTDQRGSLLGCSSPLLLSRDAKELETEENPDSRVVSNDES
jgi:hypothetical protein